MSEEGRSVPEPTLDAFVAAASDGVDFEGLTVESRDDGYRLAVGESGADGLSEEALRDAARRHRAHVTEWHFWRQQAPDQPARRAFLGWLERRDDRAPGPRRAALRDGLSRTWGQLRIGVRLDEGTRRYDLRHRADAGTPLESLAVHHEPTDLTEIARFDDRGRYRPLTTAPTLATGWAVVDLDAADCVRAVDACYPATVANWYRERTGDLDVTHWRETAERQTGIYDLVDELEGEQVEWLTRACCVDSECLKRRQWDESATATLDAPRGEGEFPCREPCSLVVAAAREFALDAREDASGDSPSLSAAETAQLERILDAVGDGSVADVRIGDVDDGANRLRVRYLREKLFGDGGRVDR